jgi:hypothetical protein
MLVTEPDGHIVVKRHGFGNHRRCRGEIRVDDPFRRRARSQRRHGHLAFRYGGLLFQLFVAMRTGHSWSVGARAKRCLYKSDH